MHAVIPDLLRRNKAQKAKETMMGLTVLIVANKCLIWAVGLVVRGYRCADFPDSWERRGRIHTCVVDWRDNCEALLLHWAAQLCKQCQRRGSRSCSLCFLSSASPSPAFAVILCGTEPAGSGGEGTAHYFSQVLALLKGSIAKWRLFWCLWHESGCY